MAFVVWLIILRSTFLRQQLAPFDVFPAATNTLFLVKVFLAPLALRFLYKSGAFAARK